jgi:hypothetical protein
MLPRNRTAMSVLALAVLGLALAEPAEPAVEPPPLPTVDQINDYLNQGIAQKKNKPNRIYTARELIAKFGEPKKRQTLGAQTRGWGEGELWTWECADGTVVAHFIVRGYASDKRNSQTMRLQIASVTPTRKSK